MEQYLTFSNEASKDIQQQDHLILHTMEIWLPIQHTKRNGKNCSLKPMNYRGLLFFYFFSFRPTFLSGFYHNVNETVKNCVLHCSTVYYTKIMCSTQQCRKELFMSNEKEKNKPTSFRITAETSDQIKELCKKLGCTQDETFQHLISAFEMQNAITYIPERIQQRANQL